jgi:hypothetical protein
LHLVHGTTRGIGRHCALALRNLLDHLPIRKIFEYLFGTHAKSAQWNELGLDILVSDLFRMQLQINPPVDAHRHDLLHLSWARAEGQTVERMHRALLIARSGIGGIVLLLREQLRDGARQAETQEK